MALKRVDREARNTASAYIAAMTAVQGTLGIWKSTSGPIAQHRSGDDDDAMNTYLPFSSVQITHSWTLLPVLSTRTVPRKALSASNLRFFGCLPSTTRLGLGRSVLLDLGLGTLAGRGSFTIHTQVWLVISSTTS